MREEDELLCISLHLILVDDKREVVEQQELQLQLVQLGERKAANLSARLVKAKLAQEAADAPSHIAS